MAEQLGEGLPVRQREAAASAARRCSLANVRVAGAEQHDIDAGFVPHKAKAASVMVLRAGLMDQKAERVGRVGEPRGTCPLAVSSRNAAASRSGREKMLRTANISSVPTRLAGSAETPGLRAFWCIMWNATIATSHMPSRRRAPSIACSGSAEPAR